MERPCARCGGLNDLQDYDFCSRCCYELAFWEREPKIPGFSLRGIIARRLGIGTVGIMGIISTEAALTHIMHHPVILPTPIGIEMIDFSGRVIKAIRNKKEIIVNNPQLRHTASLTGKFGGFLFEGVQTWKVIVQEARQKNE